MSLTREKTQRIMRGMSMLLEFNELEVVKQKFPDTEWKIVARRFF